MGFNSAFKGLKLLKCVHFVRLIWNDYITMQGAKKKRLNINFDKSLHIKCKADICINTAYQNNTFVTKDT